MKTEQSPIKHLLFWRQQNPVLYAKRRNEGVAASKKVKEAARCVSFQYRNKAKATRQRMPQFQKGEKHIRAIIWRLRSPSNQVYEFRNLAEFVRQNTGLFHVDDVQWCRRGAGELCRAYSGISSLRPYLADGTPRKRVSSTWKGWRWIASHYVEEKQ
jgi:hypothetical protein